MKVPALCRKDVSCAVSQSSDWRVPPLLPPTLFILVAQIDHSIAPSREGVKNVKNVKIRRLEIRWSDSFAQDVMVHDIQDFMPQLKPALAIAP